MGAVGRSAVILAIVLVAASCTSGDSNGGTLLTEGRPATTAPSTSIAAPTSTTTAPTTTTSIVTATSKATTTTTREVEVAAGSAGDDGTLVQLPVTGAEPGVALIALLALLIGTWFLRWSWRERNVLIHAVLWHRSPAGDWPPDAVAARTVNDRRFRRAARREARRLGIDFVGGVDAFATRWAGLHESVEDVEPEGVGWLADWERGLARAAKRIYG